MDEWGGQYGGDLDDLMSYEDAVKEGEHRIVFTGPRRYGDTTLWWPHLTIVWLTYLFLLLHTLVNCGDFHSNMFCDLIRSGKSSIERVIFHKMSPHETLFLESTQDVDIHLISNNDFVKFQTWDFGGDLNVETGVRYMGKPISAETILKGCSTLVYVIDAQEEDYEDSLPRLVETILAAYRVNPDIHFEVFLHKVDGDLMAEEIKAERQQGIQNYVSTELSAEIQGDVLVSYYLTSIYDHSALEAFSKVVQKLVNQLPILNSLLDKLIERYFPRLVVSTFVRISCLLFFKCMPT